MSNAAWLPSAVASRAGLRRSVWGSSAIDKAAHESLDSNSNMVETEVHVITEESSQEYQEVDAADDGGRSSSEPEEEGDTSSSAHPTKDDDDDNSDSDPSCVATECSRPTTSSASSSSSLPVVSLKETGPSTSAVGTRPLPPVAACTVQDIQEQSSSLDGDDDEMVSIRRRLKRKRVSIAFPVDSNNTRSAATTNKTITDATTVHDAPREARTGDENMLPSLTRRSATRSKRAKAKTMTTHQEAVMHSSISQPDSNLSSPPARKRVRGGRKMAVPVDQSATAANSSSAAGPKRPRGTVAAAQQQQRQQPQQRNMKPKVDSRVSLPKASEELCSRTEKKKRNRRIVDPWTLEEHLLFLHGLNVLGKGKWKNISAQFVKTRSSEEIRSHAQKFVKQHADGEDVFEPLRQHGDIMEELLSKAAAAGNVGVESQPSSRPSTIGMAPKCYDASAISARSISNYDEGLQKATLEYCRDELKAWYQHAEEVVRDRFGGSVSDSIGPLRDGIAKLWCTFAKLASNALLDSDQCNTRRRSEKVRSKNVEILLLDIARSCPLVGDHREVVQARLKLEFEEYDFIHSTESDTLEGFAEALGNIDVEEAKILDVLASSIALCNDSVRKSPMHLPCPYATAALSFRNDGRMTMRQRLIAHSSTLLAGSVMSLRLLWLPSHRVVDRDSASVICKEANRLSRIKEALLLAKGNDEDELSTNLGTEYGCNGGCWSVFSTKRELLQHQRTCRGQHSALGEHDKYERGKLTGTWSFLPFRDVGDAEQPGMRKDKSYTTPLNWPKMHCFGVEYGCKGCCSVFATERELHEHEAVCEGRTA